ncbi:MAG: tetratricopeptide repeat protein, partial [Nitrospinales bacterium]
SESAALIATLSIWLASPLLYYTFIRQRMAHGAEFCFSTVFLCVWLKYRESGSKLQHAVIGAVLGFLCLVRLINVVFLAVYLADLAYQNLSGWNKPARLKGVVGTVAIFSLSFLVVFSPQLYAWFLLDGNPFFYIWETLTHIQSGTASASLSSKFDKAYEIFFSPKWGIAVATPLFFAGALGLLFSRVLPKGVRVGFFAGGALFLALLISLVDPASYGMRYLIPGTAVFAFGLAELLDKARRRRGLFGVSIAFVVLCVMAQYMMLVQYKVTLPYNDPEFTFKALSAVPSLIANHSELLLRSSNFANLLPLDGPSAWNYRDILFLVVFPLSQFACVVLVLGGCAYAGRLRKRALIALHPKQVLSGVLLAVLVLLALIGSLAPVKTEQEIVNRKIYGELFKRGTSLAGEGKLDEAIELFNQVSALVPESWIPFYRLGAIYQEKQDLTRANENYRKVLAMYSGHEGALFHLGDNLKFLGKFEEAELRLQDAILAYPRNKAAYSALAQMYARQNKWEKAERCLKYAVAIDPYYANAHANLALLMTLRNRTEEAAAYLRQAVNLGASGPLINQLSQLYPESPEQDKE